MFVDHIIWDANALINACSSYFPYIVLYGNNPNLAYLLLIIFFEEIIACYSTQ